MKKFVWLFIVLSAFINSSCEDLLIDSDPEPPLPAIHDSRLATLLDSMRYAYNLPALAGAIVTDTGIAEGQSTGCRRYCGNINVTATDRFHLGSNTKALTAVLLGTLVDENLVDWSTTLSEIFPEYASSMLEEYRNVTLLNLLSHSSGMRRTTDLNPDSGSPMEQRKKVVEHELMQPAVGLRGKYLYSNLGYIIAGAIAEKILNRQYEELLRERVLLPLGITTGGFGPMGTVGMEDQPLQHTIHYAPVEPDPGSDYPAVYSPAARLHMSITDWAKYIKWVLECESGNYSLLSPETAQKLTAPVVQADNGGYYALGWLIGNDPSMGGRIIIHDGSNGLNFSSAYLIPNSHFGIIAATNINAESTPYDIYKVRDRLIKFYLNGN